MTPRIRIKLLALIGLALATFLEFSALAQNRGGGGGGRGQQQDPTQIYINQLKLEGKDRGAFRKAFNKNQQNQQKWRANIQKWQKKNQKYVGKGDVPPEIVTKLKAEKAEFDAQAKANKEAYQEALAAFLSPQQVKQVDQIAKRVAEQRAKRQAQRQQRQQGGGGGNRNR